MAQGANQAVVALVVLAGCAGQLAAPGLNIPLTVARPDGAAALERRARTLYPRCSIAPQSYAPPAPLLILTGELDDWTPAAECRRLAGGNVTLKIYPGAHHSFDSDRPVCFVAAR